MNILIIDDDEAIAAAMRAIVQSLGYQALVADSAESAEELLESNEITLAIVDYKLPGASGLQFARQLQADSVSFLIMSADNSWEAIKEAIELGALEYVVKPFSPAQMVATIEVAMSRRIENQQSDDAEVINVAAGIIMAKSARTAAEAHRFLRVVARTQRLALRDAAKELVSQLNDIAQREKIIKKYISP